MVRDLFMESHPGIQLFYFLVVILVSIFLPHPVVIGCSFLGAVLYCLWVQGWKRVIRFHGMYMLPMVILVIGINGAFSHYGVTPLYYLKSGAITLEALVYGGVLAWMLWTSIVWFSVINQVMTMDRWVYLLGRCTPVLSLALAITFRFVPRCRNQFQRIREGRRSLGIREEETFWKRMKSGAKQLSMLLTWSLESGVEMADSMRVRCYGRKNRTSYGNYCMEGRDWLLLFILVFMAAGSLLGFAMGYGKAEYNPVIQVSDPGENTGSIMTYTIWGLFCFFPAISRSIQEIRVRRWERSQMEG